MPPPVDQPVIKEPQVVADMTTAEKKKKVTGIGSTKT